MRAPRERNASTRYADNCEDAPFRVWDDNGVVRRPRIEDEVSWVVRVVLRYGIWKPAAGVVISIKHVFNAISGLGPSQACPEDLQSQGVHGQRDVLVRQETLNHSQLSRLDYQPRVRH